jgi:type II secretion system protein G
MKNQKGFTLMEVLIVVLIIGILAAIAVPNYIQALEDSKVKACQANIDVLTAQAERYRLSRGEYPTLAENQCLSDYLAEKNFLTQQVECPRGGRYILVSNKVECSCPPESD